MKYEIAIDGKRQSVELVPGNGAASAIAISVDGRMVQADVVAVGPAAYSILIGGRSIDVALEETSTGLVAHAAGRAYHVEVVDPRAWKRGRGAGIELEGRQQLVAPMPGKVVRVLAARGQQVEAGQGLLVIEAMKMQNEVRSPKSGTVEKLAQEGQTLNAGEIVAIVA